MPRGNPNIAQYAHLAGAPKGANNGNRSAETHGLVTFRNKMHRRGKCNRSIISLRSISGRNAAAVQAGLTQDLGGLEHLPTAQKVLIELVGRDLYLLAETDQRIVRACKEIPKLKNSPKGMATLYSYRMPIISSISKNLMALGLEKKPPPAKSLEQILEESDVETKPEGEE